MKKLFKIVVILVILLLIAAFVVVWQIDSIAKTTIEKGGTYALGVDTTVDGVHIGLMSGEATLDDLAVTNPQGYPIDHKLLQSGHFAMKLDTATVREDTIVVNSVLLDGLAVYMDKKDDKYNVQVITDNLKRFSSEKKKEEEKKDTEPGKKVIIKEFIIRNVTGHVEALGTKVPIKIDELVLDNISSEEGVEIDKLIGQLFPTIMNSVVSVMGDKIGDVANLLTNDLAGAAVALGGNAIDMFKGSGGDAAKVLDNVAQEMGKTLENVTKDLPGGLKDATKGLGDTLKGIGGNKEGDSNSGDAEKKDPVKSITDGIGGLIGGNKDEKK